MRLLVLALGLEKALRDARFASGIAQALESLAIGADGALSIPTSANEEAPASSLLQTAEHLRTSKRLGDPGDGDSIEPTASIDGFNPLVDADNTAPPADHFPTDHGDHADPAPERAGPPDADEGGVAKLSTGDDDDDAGGDGSGGSASGGGAASGDDDDDSGGGGASGDDDDASGGGGASGGDADADAASGDGDNSTVHDPVKAAVANFTFDEPADTYVTGFNASSIDFDAVNQTEWPTDPSDLAFSSEFPNYTKADGSRPVLPDAFLSKTSTTTEAADDLPTDGSDLPPALQGVAAGANAGGDAPDRAGPPAGDDDDDAPE